MRSAKPLSPRRAKPRERGSDAPRLNRSFRLVPSANLPSIPAGTISAPSPVLTHAPLPAGMVNFGRFSKLSKTVMTDATAPSTGLMQSVWANPILLLVITTLVWGAHSIVGRLAVGQIGPMTLVTLRWAVALVPIFIAAIPALVLLGARVFLGVRFTALQALGALVTMIGVAVIAAQGDLARLAALAFNSGDVMMVMGAVLYAGYTIGLRQRPHVSGVSMLAAMALAAFVTSVPLMIWEIMSGGFVWPTAVGLLALAFAALGPAFFAQLTYMRGVQLIGPGRAGVFVNLVPIFGVIMAVVILGEPFALYQVLALLLVVGGIAIAQRGAAGAQR